MVLSNDQVLHVRVIDKMLMHRFPYSVIAPSGESFVYAGPYSAGSSLHGAPALIQMIVEPLAISFLSNVQAGLVPRNSNTLDHRSGDSVMFDIYSV